MFLIGIILGIAISCLVIEIRTGLFTEFFRYLFWLFQLWKNK